MLGIDVSKATLFCTLLDAESKHTLWMREVPNTASGIKALLKHTSPETPWVMEPTGRYSQGVAKIAVESGRQVLLAQPKKAQNYLKSIQGRAKTDRLDSYGLGLYALNHSLRPYPLKPAMAEQLDQLLNARKGLSQAIASLEQRVTELPHAGAVLRESVNGLKEQRTELDRQIQQHTIECSKQAQTPWTAITELQRVPGIGPVVAATVVSRLSARQFAHSDQFVAYSGLDVTVRDSGQRKGQGRLSKQGDAELRRLFYLAAQASIRTKNSPFLAQYEREKAKGMSGTAALCAVSRKMARLCWSIATHGTTYDPERVYQKPKNKPTGP